MIRWAGWLITLCGVGHTMGALTQTIPHYGQDWLTWALWEKQNSDLVAMSHTTAAFWYTAFSFGPPLIVIGLAVLWMTRHGITPPSFIAWSVASWTLITAVLSGPSPLLLLLLAAVLLLIGARRAARDDDTVAEAALT
ncbi:DUF6463 family protein [Nocardia stercoris]|uniref:Uncharacterized protein n=1 Tax=Nocardia stercoris TaxID=2483361 RepID=A0A3M2L4Q7_9NOCA|nr:DUF6463 family protein [Nocardia stercoris]RMI32672.1 hypothetical protein EBN03_11940 [Nocardia stercoris]